ncbi:uncharacterized protein LOC134784035 [Penaeus indicus]|uniref:uncharacterized protein LOC134784035 n=1 Tax=Penaeus indicus TaxID=29960 RepID=UPI00300C0177
MKKENKIAHQVIESALSPDEESTKVFSGFSDSAFTKVFSGFSDSAFIEAAADLRISSKSTEFPHPNISVCKMKFLAIAFILCLAVVYTQALPAEMPSSPLLLSRVARSPHSPHRDCIPCTCIKKVTVITIIEYEVIPPSTRFGGSRQCCPCPNF